MSRIDPEALRLNLALEADAGPLNHRHVIGGGIFDVLAIAQTVVEQADEIARLRDDLRRLSE